jgi:hypothetical protein
LADSEGAHLKIGYKLANKAQSVSSFGGIPLSLYLGLSFPQLIWFAVALFAVSLIGGMFLNAICTHLEGNNDKSAQHLGMFIIALGGFYLLLPKDWLAIPKNNVAIISLALIFFGTLLLSAPAIARRWFYDDRQ